MGTSIVSIALACVVLLADESKQQYYKTKEEAIQHVPQHVVPKDCFVWKDGSAATPWRVIPGTGCAHWVAHQKKIRHGAKCFAGCSIRVRDVVHGLTRHDIADAKVQDIWTMANLSHCGLVVGLNKDKAGKIVSVEVQNCSSAKGGVVTSTVSSGSVYREAPKPVTGDQAGMRTRQSN